MRLRRARFPVAAALVPSEQEGLDAAMLIAYRTGAEFLQVNAPGGFEPLPGPSSLKSPVKRPAAAQPRHLRCLDQGEVALDIGDPAQHRGQALVFVPARLAQGA
jgi:hypothetical protein